MVDEEEIRQLERKIKQKEVELFMIREREKAKRERRKRELRQRLEEMESEIDSYVSPSLSDEIAPDDSVSNIGKSTETKEKYEANKEAAAMRSDAGRIRQLETCEAGMQAPLRQLCNEKHESLDHQPGAPVRLYEEQAPSVGGLAERMPRLGTADMQDPCERSCNRRPPSSSQHADAHLGRPPSQQTPSVCDTAGRVPQLDGDGVWFPGGRWYEPSESTADMRDPCERSCNRRPPKLESTCGCSIGTPSVSAEALRVGCCWSGTAVGWSWRAVSCWTVV